MDSLGGFWWNLEIQDGGPMWQSFGNHDVIPASCDVVSSWCGPQTKQFQKVCFVCWRTSWGSARGDGKAHRTHAKVHPFAAQNAVPSFLRYFNKTLSIGPALGIEPVTDWANPTAVIKGSWNTVSLSARWVVIAGEMQFDQSKTGSFLAFIARHWRKLAFELWPVKIPKRGSWTLKYV